ncbi:NAD-dependent epimerase/dehydratase family protein [bacterium]|nr:NAD-dependent epimerase/dehydratase family protein [bacterium]
MSILVTGSSGYFGKIVISDLIGKGLKVSGIDIRRDPRQTEGEQFRFYECSITDRAKLREIFNREQPSVVLHFACTFNKVRDRKQEYEIDVEGSENVLKACNETHSVKRLIYSSSAAIYGAANRNGEWISETEPVDPGKYRYGINKKLIEEAYFSADRRADLQIVSLRICTVVGPAYFKTRSVVSILIRLPYLPSSFRKKKVQFMHEEDFVTLICMVMNDDEIEGIYNVAADSFSIVGEVVPAKKYIQFPVAGLKPVLWILWNLRILNLQPASLKYCLYPVLIDPTRLARRYGYNFRYSSSESFAETVRNNSLPPDSKF